MTIYFAEDKEKIRITCERCGYESITSSRNLYRQTNLKLCQSCKSTQANTVVKNGLACTPHRGEVDLNTMAPLNNEGEPYLPGYRICGMADCVNRSHILKERNFKSGMGILRGQVISFDDFILIEERRKA
jgi:hypothetical protein